MTQINSPKALNLLFPQWQGSGATNELYNGAMLIRDCLQNRGQLVSVPVALNQTLKLEKSILGYSSIIQQLSQAKKIVQQHNPDRLFVIGGDCSIDIAPISFLNQKYERDLAVIWIDAHADLNTPASSPSHHFHGMPLRVLLGEGNAKIIELSSSVLSPKQVFLVGARDFDPPERNYLEQQNIPLFAPKTVIRSPHRLGGAWRRPPSAVEDSCQDLIKAIANSNYRNIHIHCDLDAIDPLEFPWVKCPVKNGLSLELLTDLLQQLSSCFNLVGFSMTEFAPVEKQGLEKITKLVSKMFARLQY